jgi:energy-coupling factor transporter ATP-binding protein EcfA2
MAESAAPSVTDSIRALDDPKVRKLETLIRRSFRVHENRTPVYVDVADNLARVSLDQHQIVFGRRGSGKSCLLVYFRRVIAPKSRVHTIYINGDTIKTLDYPDVLIRLLLAAFEGLPARHRLRRAVRRVFRRPSSIHEMVEELRALLALPSRSKLKVTKEQSRSTKKTRSAQLKKGPAQAGVGRDDSGSSLRQEVRESEDEKIRVVDGRLVDYKAVIQREVSGSRGPYAVFIIDDFYLVNPEHHAEVVDYLHRLLRDTDLYLKIGTIRHRTRLSKTHGIRYGVQPYQDVDTFNLDQTLEDLGRTSTYLEDMLRKLGQEVGLEDATSIMSDDARNDLVLLSGGVPRDYLNIFVEGLGRARNLKGRRRMTPTDLRQAAASLSQASKFADLRDATGGEAPELETLFVDLVKFCLNEKRKTAFLISKDEIAAHPAVHEFVLQLMDFKLIHLVEPSTSAASGRPGRYEAYTLDFALFMEPRKRNIEIVKFWLTDDEHRRVRLREAPVYELSRGDKAIKGDSSPAEEALRVAAEVPPAPKDSPELKLFDDAAL